MALQITVTPLTSALNLVTLCQDVFPACELAPSPHESHVFMSAEDTQIEAIAHDGSLSFELHSRDLQDTSLTEALFDIATRGPCALWSDDAACALVTDETLASKAAQALDLPLDEIDIAAAPRDIADLLFGIEPPRPASPDLAAGLTAHGFRIKKSQFHRATRRTPTGTRLDLDPDEHCTWQTTSGVSLSLAQPRFAQLMQGWTPTLSGPLTQLDARKLRQDKTGALLWSGHLPFAQTPATLETAVLGLYDAPIPLGTLVDALLQTEDPAEMAHEIFGGTLAPFVMPTEGLWVFLFLLAEAAQTSNEIVSTYTTLKNTGAAFGTDQSLTLDIAEAYLDLHRTQLGTPAPHP